MQKGSPNNLSSIESSHLERLKAGISEGTPALDSWILGKIRLKGKKFSFFGHEYQQTILKDTHNKKVIKKCSQIGASEINMCRALAFINLHPGTKLSYVLPSAKFAQKFVKMRFDPLIQGSPEVKERLEKGSDSSELKQFGDSFFMSQGASSTSSTNVLAIDLDALVVDELDGAENPDVINQLISRLTHSPYKDEFYLSTPTVPGYGISAKYELTKKHVMMQRCDHCGHWFQPDYYRDIVLPGLNHLTKGKPSIDLKEVSFLTAKLIEPFDLKTAFLRCPNPKCHRPVDTLSDPLSREFICENPMSNAEFHGYHVPPFAVPHTITPGDLILKSVRYSRLQDFYNDGLGLDLSSAETGLNAEEVASFFQPSPAFNNLTSRPPYTVMGLDLGGECACTIAYPGPDHLRVVHAEMIPLRNLRKRVSELYAAWRIIASVVDSLPYTDTVMMLQDEHPTMYASLFSNNKSLSLYDVREINTEDNSKAMSTVRSINVARDRGFDLLTASLREGGVKFDPLPLVATTLQEHMLDLKRIFIPTFEGDGKFTWRKTSGVDHYFFSLLYLFLASCMHSAGVCSGPRLSVGMPLLQTIKNSKL